MDVTNKKVVVVGMGRTSMALVRLLLREGALPVVTDLSNASALQPYKERLEEWGVPYECGGHSDDVFSGSAIVIPSPGVAPGIEAIRHACEAGAELIGEMEFAFGYCRSKVIAVTGTNGKTTTTELLRHLIEACGNSVVLAGNNDCPLSEAVMREPAPEYIVLELSSYQLEVVRSFHPWIGIVLNLSEDHLERHGTMDDYASAKGRIFAYQTAREFAVINADDARCVRLVAGVPGRPLSFSATTCVDAGLWLDGDTFRDGDEAVATTGDVRLPGRHNLENVLAALTAMRAGGFAWDRVLQALRTFEGVEHRLETVTVLDGVTYVNDSKSTNLDSLRVALESFDRSVVLIAGGRGKGGDYAQLAELVSRRVPALIALGEDAPRLEEAYRGVTRVVHAEDMDDAVAQASRLAGAGDVVLLSPGCASFDRYTNFEERGRDFKRAVGMLDNQQEDVRTRTTA